MCAPSSPSVQAWRPWLERVGVDFGDPSRDIDRMFAWIGEESCGNAAALGAPYEVGIFQLDLQDGPAWGASIQSLHGAFTSSATSQTANRALTDAEKELQVSSGLAYVKHARAVALGQLSAHGLDWSDDDTWCLTKLQHGLPGIPGELLGPCVTIYGTGIGWSEFRDYVTSLAVSDLPSNLQRYASGFERIFDNAEAVGYLAGADGGGSSSLILGAVLLVALFLLTR